jgi:acyl-CoA reductase-like NAD-dependent aldehyde dehydrogenase
MSRPEPPPGSETGSGPGYVTVRSPWDGSAVGGVPELGAADVDRAVRTAREALASQPLEPWQRAAVLDRAVTLLSEPERSEALARTIAAEAAKPLKTARVEAQRAIGTFTFAAVEARRLAGEMVPVAASPVGSGKLAFTLRVPIGVVGAIAPFNFPLNLVAHKVAPAIAAGCPVVLKPASQTPLTALLLATMLVEECGLPAGYLHVVTGGGGTVGNALVDHPDVAMITFTGSPEVGWAIQARAPRKRVRLELGNNSPVIIEPDADIERAASAISVAGFSHAGQSCISTQRIYVHESVARRFTDALVPRVEALVVGDPLDPDTDVSALINRSEAERVSAWLEEAVAGGARVLCGGPGVVGSVVRPTVLSGVTPDMQVCRNEVFGPVVGIATYTDFDDAVRLANDTRYGLQAAVYTSDLGRALTAARSLDFGGVIINETPTWRADQMPYGGLRDSGNTREGPHWTVQEMTESRLVVIHG